MMSDVTLGKFPYKRFKPHKDPFLVKGHKQQQHLAFSRSGESGYVSVIGKTSLNAHTPGREDSLPFTVTTSLIRHIFKKELGVNISSLEQDMNDLFPYTVRHHETTTHKIHIVPNDGFFGIEWIVQANLPTATTMPRKTVLLSAGVARKNTATTATFPLTASDTTSFTTIDLAVNSITVKEFIQDCTNILTAYTGNKGAHGGGSTTSVPYNDFDGYPANTFRWLLQSYGRNFTNPTLDYVGLYTQTVNAKDVSLYGYRIVKYDSDNLSQSTNNESEFSYMFGPIVRLDDQKIYAEEFTTLQIRNITPADNGSMETTTYDNNPVKGRMFYFKGDIELNTIYGHKAIYGDNDDLAANTTTAADGLVSDLNQVHYNQDSNTTAIPNNTTFRHSSHLFSTPTDDGIILLNNAGTDNVALYKIPSPNYFKNALYEDFILQPGQKTIWPLKYKFSGYLPDFYKNCNISGSFPPYHYMSGDVSVESRLHWANMSGTSLIACLEKIDRHNSTEDTPTTDVDIRIKRKAILTSKKLQYLDKTDFGHQYVTLPAIID